MQIPKVTQQDRTVSMGKYLKVPTNRLETQWDGDGAVPTGKFQASWDSMGKDGTLCWDSMGS